MKKLSEIEAREAVFIKKKKSKKMIKKQVKKQV
jgi:hypothetical protein